MAAPFAGQAPMLEFDDVYRQRNPHHAHLLTGRQFPLNTFGKDIKPTDVNRRLELPPDAYVINGEVCSNNFTMRL